VFSIFPVAHYTHLAIAYCLGKVARGLLCATGNIDTHYESCTKENGAYNDINLRFCTISVCYRLRHYWAGDSNQNVIHSAGDSGCWRFGYRIIVDRVLLGYNTALLSDRFPTFRTRRLHVSFQRSAASKTLEDLRFFEIWGIACTVMPRLMPEERMRRPHLCDYLKTPTGYHFSHNLCSMYRNGWFRINYREVWNSGVCVEPYSVLLTCCSKYAVICLCCYLNPLPKAITLHYEYTTPVYLRQRNGCEFWFPRVYNWKSTVYILRSDTCHDNTFLPFDDIQCVFFLRSCAEAEEPSRVLVTQKFASLFLLSKKSL